MRDAPTHIKDLVADPANRRAHTPRNVGMIVDALQRVGAARSIVIDEDDVILAGNGVTEAAAEAGITRVRVIEADGEEIIAVRRRGLTPEQKRALAMYDNRAGELATWNADQLAADHVAGLDLRPWFSAEEMERILPVKEGLNDPDDVPQARVTSIVNGDCFALGVHRLLCGDSTDDAVVSHAVASGEVDCVFTSLPYGVGVDYASYDDTMVNLRALLPMVARIWRAVVTPGGFAVLNFGDIVSGRAHAGTVEPCEYPMALEYWPVFRAEGWHLWSRRVWCKPNSRVHSPWAMRSNRAASDWEHVWTWKSAGEAIVHRVNGAYQSANGWFDTTTEAGVDIGKDEHGAGMAVALPVRMISIHSRLNGLVLDPFCGTGTTLIACEQTSRRCAAIDIEPVYCQMTIDRWEAFTGGTAVKVENLRLTEATGAGGVYGRP